MPGQKLEKAEAHQAGGHRHSTDPAGLEAEVHVGKADNQANQKSHKDASQREALALDLWRFSICMGHHGTGRWCLFLCGLIVRDATLVPEFGW